MTSYYQGIKDDLEGLILDGRKLYTFIMDEEDTASSLLVSNHLQFVSGYQTWYTRSSSVIKQLIPHRYEDFKQLYNAIDGHCNVVLDPHIFFLGDKTAPNKPNYLIMRDLNKQIEICKSAVNSLGDRLAKMKSILQADIFNSELDAAMHLHKNGYLRAAGSVAGVVLECHLQQVAINHGISIPEKYPTISVLNEPLKGHGVYDIPTWRNIQRLADIRNLCDHKKARDPTKEEVLDLIGGVKSIVENIG